MMSLLENPTDHIHVHWGWHTHENHQQVLRTNSIPQLNRQEWVFIFSHTQEISKRWPRSFLEICLASAGIPQLHLKGGGPRISCYWLRVQKASPFMGFSCPSGIRGSCPCKGRKCDNCWKWSTAAHGSDWHSLEQPLGQQLKQPIIQFIQNTH